MNEPNKPPTHESFDRAAALILDGIEEALDLKPIDGKRSSTHHALVKILEYYFVPKLDRS